MENESSGYNSEIYEMVRERDKGIVETMVGRLDEMLDRLNEIEKDQNFFGMLGAEKLSGVLKEVKDYQKEAYGITDKYNKHIADNGEDPTESNEVKSRVAKISDKSADLFAQLLLYANNYLSRNNNKIENLKTEEKKLRERKVKLETEINILNAKREQIKNELRSLSGEAGILYGVSSIQEIPEGSREKYVEEEIDGVKVVYSQDIWIWMRETNRDGLQ